MTPLRIVLVYVAFGAAWVLLSDRVLSAFVPDPAQRDSLQTVKGAVYVAATALLLWLLVRRQHAERRVLYEEVRAVLEGMADAVLVLDDAGTVVDVNRAALRLLGAGTAGDLLVPLPDLLERVRMRHADGRPVRVADSAAQRALHGETISGWEARACRADGKELFISISAAPLRARADETPRRAVAVVRDISEVKAFEETREEFLATAAHEFKTPLAVVKAYAQLMRKRGQGDAAALDVIVRQADRLARMVQQLLEVSRFRVGGTELRRDRFDLADLLGEVADGMRPEAEGRRIRVERGAPAAVFADRQRIAQVIASLLENAVRFSPEGGDVEVTLAQGDGEAVISIRDHGVGIPRERQGRVFERYYRAHAGTGRDYGGLGIGLDMSREIVARHGGRIWFDSQEGRGSTFSFSLPLAGADAVRGALPAGDAAPGAAP
jgi:signal transduction histidine kinase